MPRASSLDHRLQPSLMLGERNPKQVFRALRDYLAGQFVGATRDDALLDEVMKCLFCKLYLDTYPAYDKPQIDDEFSRASF